MTISSQLKEDLRNLKLSLQDSFKPEFIDPRKYTSDSFAYHRSFFEYVRTYSEKVLGRALTPGSLSGVDTSQGNHFLVIDRGHVNFHNYFKLSSKDPEISDFSSWRACDVVNREFDKIMHEHNRIKYGISKWEIRPPISRIGNFKADAHIYAMIPSSPQNIPKFEYLANLNNVVCTFMENALRFEVSEEKKRRNALIEESTPSDLIRELQHLNAQIFDDDDD